MEIKNQPKLTNSILWLMTISTGLVVANNYYNQPLLGLMAKDFNVKESQISAITMCTQIGYAFGLFFFIPLGDRFKRKKLILIDFIFVIMSLLAMAVSKSVVLLFPISFVIGFTSVIPQLFVPMAASLAQPEERPKVVGIVMGGLLVGILGSRVLSGYVGDVWGWRTMYYIAAIIMIILFVLIYFKLPEVYPKFKGTYKQLMKSLFELFKKDPDLRMASLRGALAFGSLSAFWTPLVFHLEKNFQLSNGAASNISGKFGLVGACGAIVAVFIGKVIPKYNKKTLLTLFSALTLLSWFIFYWGGFSYLGLIVGVILVDIGVQATHITNQSIIFSSNPEASNRVNTIYMTSYFIGGSIGTALAANAFQYYNWFGVVFTGGFIALLLMIFHLYHIKSQKQVS
ncbi:MFS transporter [Apibacter muscae]|uniref:MFS transporter n=1 Tax=Apibacter muscae TaxID=2509004 RepID=A0A563D803_9FLAO|nr:MFS transporter [Apibacter muscae]TWP26212.1 MFS transporter [Apibacter muscae]